MCTVRGLIAGSVAGLVLAGASAARANFLVNPGLTPSSKVSGGMYHRNTKSTKQPVSGWTVIGAVDVVSPKYWQTNGAGYSVDLIGAPGLGAIQQTITGLTAGDVYSFSFDVATNPAKGTREFNAIKDLAVGLVGSDMTAPKIYALTTPTKATRKNMQYRHETLTFTANSPSVTLILAGRTSANLPRGRGAKSLYCGPVVSNLAVEFVSSSKPDIPVPEPASLALLGLGGMALLARRRRS